MTRSALAANADIATDPFAERRRTARRATLQLLGARLTFESDSAELMRLAEWAFAGLPQHMLVASAPRLAVRLVLGGGTAAGTRDEPEPLATLSAAGMLCGASAGSNVVTVCPAQRAALVVVARELLRFPYHVRYELIEFAVFTLAARVQRLVPLHAACVGSGGRGLLLLGASGAGKSTAMLHCALAGLDVVSEDSLFVSPGTLRATGVANFLHIRKESLRFVAAREAAALGRSPVIRRRSGVEKLEIDLRQPRFRLAPRPVELAGVVELSALRTGAAASATALGSRQLLERLRDGQPYAANLPGWPVFSRAIRRLPAFELRRGRHPEETVAALRQLLRDIPRGRRRQARSR
ncbi:MAG: serine kinase [Steroidobacteraceae bacterium]